MRNIAAKQYEHYLLRVSQSKDIPYSTTSYLNIFTLLTVLPICNEYGKSTSSMAKTIQFYWRNCKCQQLLGHNFTERYVYMCHSLFAICGTRRIHESEFRKLIANSLNSSKFRVSLSIEKFCRLSEIFQKVWILEILHLF